MTYKKICKKCSREFETEISNKSICNSCITGDSNSVFHCLYCGAPISYNKKFCSHSCNSKYNLSKYNPFSDNSVMDAVRENQQLKLQDKNYKKSITDKIKATKLEKYGDENYHNIEKMKQTNLSRYGVEFNFSSSDEHINGKETLNKLMQDEEYRKSVIDKREQTSLENNGVKNIFQDTEYIKSCKIKTSGSLEKSYKKGLEKSKQTNVQKYGKEFYTQTDEYKSISKETRDKRISSLGYFLPIQNNYCDEFKKLLYDRDKSIDYLKNKKYTINDLSINFNCSITAIVKWVKRLNLQEYVQFHVGSKYEKELMSIFGELNFKLHYKLPNGKEIDLYNEEKRIGIEFNGDYWHSDINKNKSYHFDKSIEAQNNDIRLIHIYEYEWLDERIKPILISLINIACGKVDKKIYARNCVIKQISNIEARDFNNKNHLQGHRNAQITYGLFYEDELVQLMSFSYDKKCGWWEIIRGCPGSNNIVIGGVSKLFKHFIKEQHPDKIFSYCDFNKFDGTGYEKIGMKFIGYTGPDKTWLINGKAVKRQPSKHKQLKELAEASIWGAGSKKYLWTNVKI
mgnify:CR=1 FL=1